MARPIVHIVTPCYQPDGDWAARYAGVVQQVQAWDFAEVRCVIVDDGSPQAVVSPHPDVSVFRYVDNKGKGYAIRYGISKIEGNIVVYTDVDFPYETQSLELITKAIVQGDAEVVMGKRSEEYFRQVPLQRRLISKALIWLNSYILRLNHPDTQCGLKAIKWEALEVFGKTKQNGFLFEIEFLKKAQKLLKVDTVDVKLHGQTTLNNVSLKMLWKQLSDYRKLIKK